MEMVHRHDVRQDDGSDEPSPPAVVAAVDGRARRVWEVRPQELLFYSVHFFDWREWGVSLIGGV